MMAWRNEPVSAPEEWTFTRTGSRSSTVTLMVPTDTDA
jgi:hypothetical protein